MSYAPKFRGQLGHGIPVPGGTQGSRDCGPQVVAMGVDFLTRGAIRPRIAELRRRMGVPGPQRTDIWDANQGVESYVPTGRKGLRYFIKSRVADVRTAVAAGKFVQACVDYGELNRQLAKTGDPAFRGGHSVGILGQRRRDGVTWWLMWDPLDDHRRPEIPQGPRWVPRHKLVAAMEAFAGGEGRCYAGIFGGGQRRQ